MSSSSKSSGRTRRTRVRSRSSSSEISEISDSEPELETENSGTIKLKEIVKTLLDRGYKYKHTTLADIKLKSSEVSAIYETKPSVIPGFNNWKSNWRNDSSILLMFETDKAKKAKKAKKDKKDFRVTLNQFDKDLITFLPTLGYRYRIIEKSRIDTREKSPGSSIAIFEKTYELKGTGMVGKRIDTNHVVATLPVTVKLQYDSNFDHLHQKEYYDDGEVDYDDGEVDYEYREDPLVTTVSDRFMRSLINGLTGEVSSEISGGRKTRKHKKSRVVKKTYHRMIQ